MKSQLAINGFGRIGRTFFRVLHQRADAGSELELCAINEIGDAATVLHLARYDSTHGRFTGALEGNDGALIVNGRSIALTHQPDVEKLPWAQHDIDLVLECTGAFTDRATAELHLSAGAHRVLFSQPAKANVDATIVWGINNEQLQRDQLIISAGSCTTNAIVPVLDVLNKQLGITAGTITTIHSAMNDQPVLDAYHHTDLRKTRAASQSIIPVDTALAVGIQRILPELSGKLTAHALRVPTLNVSAIDLAVYTREPCSAETVNDILQTASAGSLKGILGFTTEPLASCDFAGEACSGVVDASQTQVSADHLVKVLVWFDNEWAYANRLVDIALALHRMNANGDRNP
ncbi:D-erythrose-4-phosphate dehydrogenase [Luminiphilus syltensis NOR5-1B]|uniref:D-erythrose-4-phosphate dehydrogenase n=1 Tax=Luminiphilus syltensis NOR5-1B TaxID=565045 RepID=B8KU58_9GAMM|nr:glyceraldehyde 3-phosphate dehydrogenase NAD-binding domain-containing protein [Luminiphilus syltensis]EED35604.1 D-erythrose-4-phosphate dehydrogenase [Luminiphilus syltensis NOR5-1B]